MTFLPRLKHLFLNLSLGSKMITLFIIAAWIPFLIFSQIMISLSGEKIIDQSIQLTSASMNQIATNVVVKLTEKVLTAEGIYYDKMLWSYFDQESVYRYALESLSAYESYLWPVVYYDTYISESKNSVRILYFNDTLIQDTYSYIQINDYVRKTLIFQSAVAADGQYAWLIDSKYIYRKAGDQKSVFLTRLVKSQAGEDLGIIALEMPEQQFKEIVSEYRWEDQQVYILNETGMVIASNNPDLYMSDLSAMDFVQSARSSGQGVYDQKIGGDSYKMIVNNLSGDPLLPSWQIVSLVPLEQILRSNNQVRLWAYVFGGGILLFSIFMLILFTRTVTARLGRLSSGMNAVERDEYIEITEDDSTDEVGRITRTYNSMIKSLHELIHENYEVNLRMKNIELKKRDAEIMMLQSQIDPHFLFNTLESIRMALIRQDDRENANAVLSLSRILKASYSLKGDKVRLQDEVSFVQNYLQIQKYKYRDKIVFSIDIPESCLNYLIPKLIIQPIIDNSIQHGFAKTRKKCTIKLKIRELDEQLLIEITDDGAGIDPPLLNEIRQALNQHEELRTDRFVGLKNVNERIHLYYGEQFGLELCSEPGTGTQVRLTVPVDRSKEP